MDLSALTDVDADALSLASDNKPSESRDSQPLNEAPLQPEQIPSIDEIINNNNIATDTTTTVPTTDTSIDPPLQPDPPQEPIPESIPQQQQEQEQKQSIQLQEEEKKQELQESIPEAKNEFIDINYDDDNDTDNDELNALDLPIVDSLQPDELCLTIQDTINKMSQCDPIKQSRLIMAYKDNLIQQLEKLQNISAAIDSLNDMQSTAENLPKNSKTGYPNINAIDLALREHCFFAEQINTFGMLLIEICDISKIKEKHSLEHTQILLKQMCSTISYEFIYQHLLFHYNSSRLVLLVYIENEKELMICGREIIRLLTSHSYEIKDEILHSTISVGAAIYENNNLNNSNNSNENNEPFDFRTWLKNAELGLNKSNNSGLKNQCCIARENDIISAIIPSMNNDSSKSNSNSHKKHTKSTLSLLARSRDRTHSSGTNSYNKLTLNDITNKLTPQQIRASIRLYDKLIRLKIDDNYKLIALSLCTRLKEDGANYNFQHPNYNGNSILMLCCNQNIDIIIKYFCIKLYNQIDFNLINNDGNNALMCAILNKNITNDIIKLLATKTSDKLLMNHNGQTAVQLAQKMERNDLIPLLQ